MCGERGVDRQLMVNSMAPVGLCRECFIQYGKTAPKVKQRESAIEGMKRVARAEGIVAGEPTELERHLAAQAAQEAADDLLQMKRELES